MMSVHLQNSTKDLKATVKARNWKSPVNLKWALQTLARLKM
jgi:hypothetical protein